MCTSDCDRPPGAEDVAGGASSELCAPTLLAYATPATLTADAETASAWRPLAGPCSGGRWLFEIGRLGPLPSLLSCPDPEPLWPGSTFLEAVRGPFAEDSCRSTAVIYTKIRTKAAVLQCSGTVMRTVVSLLHP